ncbi:hypothetical protein ACSBR2_030960 [Camellia fascicularis]
MQDFIGSVRQSLVFKPFGGFVEKIGSSIRKSVIGLFSKPSVPALPPIAKSDAIKVKKDDAPPIQWRKGELIGCGAFGRVYMGLNIDSGALLAIKQVSIAANSTSKEKIQAHIREVEEEVNLLKNLSHPNIIRYLGTTREEDSLNILLEIVPGGSISSLLEKFGSFPESVIRMYTKQLLLGLEYLHRNGIMHRDIKGANILVDNKGCIKLADFGASKKVVELATMTGAKSMKGTPYWMAPEVILQTGHSFSADIWSVGCTVIEMATGKPPWSQQYQEVAALFHIGTTKSHPPIPEHLSVEAIDFLLKCMQKEPNLRPTASDLLQHPFVIGECQETYPEKFPGSVPHWGSGNCDDDMFQIDDEDDLVIGASAKFDSALFSDDFNKSFNPMFEPDDNWPCKSDDTLEKFPGSVSHWGSCNCDDDMCQIDDEDDLVIGAPAKFDSALLSDDFNKSFNPMSEPDDNWPCKSDDTAEKLPGSVPHWGSSNCDDDMCQIDDEDDLVIGASAKFDSALLPDDFSKSFNPMSEPEDNWPCKFDDTPELESRVNLFFGQTVNQVADIPRASGKGNNDFTFPCRPLVADEEEDDDEVIESKIRAFLDEKLINPRFVSRCLMLALVCVSFWWTTFSFCKLRMKNVLLYDSNDNPREETVKPMVDGGTEGFKGHARVIVPGVTPCFECTIWLFPPQVKFPLCTLAKTPRTATHCIEYAHLIKWDEVHSGKTFDPDIPEHMQWVYSEAIKRAELFGIPRVTYSLTQGVVKTVIPAIASTNAIISAACALETLKIASRCSKTLSNYLTYNGVEGLHTKVTEFVKDKDCLIRGPGILVDPCYHFFYDLYVLIHFHLTIAMLDDTVTVDVVIVCLLIDTCNPWYCCGSTVLFFYFVLHPFIDLLEEHPQLLLSRASVTHRRKNLYMQVPPVLEEMTRSNLDLPFFDLMDKIPKDVVHVTGMASKSDRKISSLRKLHVIFKDVNGVADMDTASGA